MMPAENLGGRRGAASRFASRGCIVAFLIVLQILSPWCAGVCRGCSSWVVDCNGQGENKMVMNGRTIDFGVLSITAFGQVYTIPKGKSVDLTAATSAKDKESITAKYSYAYTGTEFLPGMRPFNLDGVNSAGLAIGSLWQSNVSFHAAYNSSGPSKAVFVFDLGDVLLSNFSTVQQVRDYFSPSNVQLITQVFDDETAGGLDTLFGVDPDIPEPTDGNVFYIGIHFHVTDATGDSVLIEATRDGSYALYDTKVVTNEPAWPLMLQQHEAYRKYNFSGVPGVPEKSNPPNLPLVIPFNSAVDSKEGGYFGSESRNLRLMFQIENCEKYPWVDQGWSPGYTGMDPPEGLDLSTFTTLKRVENYMSSIVVPRSQLVGPASSNDYATEIAFIKDNTNKVYYYKMPRNNMWTSVDVKDIDNQDEIVLYPLDPVNQPFSVKATPVGASEPSSDGSNGEAMSGSAICYGWKSLLIGFILYHCITMNL